MNYEKEGYVIPVGGGQGSLECLKFLVRHDMRKDPVHLLVVQGKSGSYHKVASAAKSKARIEKQETQLTAGLDYCKRNGLECKGARVITHIPSESARQSEMIAKAVCDYATENKLGTVLTGSRKLSGLKRWLVGSIGQKLHQDCAACNYIQVRHQ